jgi:phosphatidylserine decarboxylase
METVWAGLVTPPRGKKITRGDWSRHEITLQRGQEMGRFNMGSTVIVLLPPSAVSALEDLGPQDIVLMGQRLARLR